MKTKLEWILWIGLFVRLMITFIFIITLLWKKNLHVNFGTYRFYFYKHNFILRIHN